MKCLSCNHENRDSIKFCESCGTKMVVEIVCASCNKTNPVGFKFCKHCGSGVEAAQASAAPENVAKPRAEENLEFSVPEASEQKALKKSQISEKHEPEKNGIPFGKIIVVVLLVAIGAWFLIGKNGDPGSKSNVQNSNVSVAKSTKSLMVNPIDVTSTLASSVQPELANLIKATHEGNQKSFDSTLENLEKIQKPEQGDRKSARKLNDAGLAALKTNDLDGAIQDFSEAVISDHLDQEAANNLGYAYYLKADYKSALNFISYALALSPRRVSGWTNYAVSMYKLGNKDEAVDAYLIGYRFSKTPAKVLAFVEKQAQEDADEDLRPFYSLVVTNINSMK